ncbi:MAG: HAD-IIA family hydrolase [Actinomycetota bacterium]|nr:HAD-IIA family hydrolase [Actinomycetota bacterium]
MGADDLPTLARSDRPLAEAYDVALLDLDGVVYVGRDAVRHACSALRGARKFGMRLTFVTNNAARPPAAVASHLIELGVDASAGEVVTSAQAAVHYLADRLPARARVLVVGTVGLTDALLERDLVPVFSAEDDPVAVVQGYSPDLTWSQLAEGAVAIERGVLWVATNADPTVPSPRGPLPGNGSLVAALRHATGATPVVTGKPEPTMHRESVQRSGARHPLVVGDRLDTDIEGANAAGCASLLVFTGVTSPRDLMLAEAKHRPSYIGADLRALLVGHAGPDTVGGVTRCGAWSVRETDAGHFSLSSNPAPPSPSAIETTDDLDAVRAVCCAVWAYADAVLARGRSIRLDGSEAITVAGADAEAAARLATAGI